MKLIQQGAEAKIFLDKKTILKTRIPKTYRHPTLDNKIRTRRTRTEAKILTRAKEAKINVPKLLHTEKFNLTIEHIPGDRLSKTLNEYPEKTQCQTMQKLGRQVARLHKNDIIHADLTTSNTILHEKKVYLIDFGLSYVSVKIEDKAVDLHLLKHALAAKHYQNAEKLFKEFLKGYKFEDSEKIIDRLRIVEKRGRYKH